MTPRIRNVSVVLFVSMLIAACQQQPGDIPVERSSEASSRPASDMLDLQTAQSRKERLSGLEYELFIDIHSGNDEYLGKATIRFELGDASSDLTLDFGGGVVEEIRLNNALIETQYNNYFITLPAAALQQGLNVVDIAYRHAYAKDGNGLHHFVDPEDGRTYLYTYLWPYYANRLFPSFDQPSLKANFSLAVLAPEDWVVVSAKVGEPGVVDDGARLWRFAATPKMSTYIFSLHAGPYTIWEDKWEDVPLRLMARQSIAEFVAVEEWFDVTQRGLQHYESYFDIPYPFEKYDQLIVPDFNIGAMEDIAAVTFQEGYVQRQRSDRSEREARAGTILHEMAHMWFGDLVTHDWWNGMWLNESFATQMSAIAKADVTEFTDTWHGFFVGGKQAAYARDGRVTTHPIEVPISGTDEFFTVFDAITYQKGSSALKQLEHFVGEENYRLGVSAYLQEHAYGTTELADFVGHQEQSSGIDLEAWSDEWLYKAGFNTLSSEIECGGDILQSLTVTQSAPIEHPYLRTHRVDVALYTRSSEGQLVSDDIISVKLEGARTPVDIPDGLSCPILVNPNHNDWTYAKVRLDAATAAALEEQLSNVADPFARSMFLVAMFDAAMAGDMPIADYVDHAMRLAETETDTRVVQQISASVDSAVDLMRRLQPETNDALVRLTPILEEQSLRWANTAATEDLKRIWFNTFLETVSSPMGLRTTRALLEGETSIQGIEMSSDIRWALLAILSRHGTTDIDDLLQAESVRDPSDYGVKSLLLARAAKPVAADKAAFLDEIRQPKQITGLAQQRYVMAGLFPSNQTGLQLELLDQVLSGLTELSGNSDVYFMSSYAGSLLTPMCRLESTALMLATLDEFADTLDSTALLFLREAQQADSECLALRGKRQ